ncbi:MAG TPA: histidine phosphatase family protein [Steroidobacteraceae bacterium]|jgi:phosphohistidine phosphatase|nr:histidine phosphatase family protein [Steroidobacteraceae bacterium]
MHLYLVRHAIAAEPDAKHWPDDRQRPLTAAGARRFKRTARSLVEVMQAGGKVERLLSSPLVRARETAAILQRAGLPEPIEESVLAPGRTAARVLAVLRAHDAHSIVVVGHEPDLSRLLVVCIGGPGAKLATHLRKGGAACLYFAGAPRVGEATLEWLLPPKALRALQR